MLITSYIGHGDDQYLLLEQKQNKTQVRHFTSLNNYHISIFIEEMKFKEILKRMISVLWAFYKTQSSLDTTAEVLLQWI